MKVLRGGEATKHKSAIWPVLSECALLLYHKSNGSHGTNMSETSVCGSHCCMGDMAGRIRKVLAICNVTHSFETAPSNDFTTFVNHHPVEAHP